MDVKMDVIKYKSEQIVAGQASKSNCLNLNQ